MNLKSGIARIDYNGTGTWIAASNAASDAGISKVVMNCAPALSNDHKTLYVAVNNGNYGYGYLVAVDSRTLAPLAKVRLKDVKNTANDSIVPMTEPPHPPSAPMATFILGCWRIRGIQIMIAAGCCISTAYLPKRRCPALSVGMTRLPLYPPPLSRLITATRPIC